MLIRVHLFKYQPCQLDKLGTVRYHSDSFERWVTPVNTAAIKMAEGLGDSQTPASRAQRLELLKGRTSFASGPKLVQQLPLLAKGWSEQLATLAGSALKTCLFRILALCSTIFFFWLVILFAGSKG